MKKSCKVIRKQWIPASAGMTFLLLFSFFLMFHTFGYDAKRQSITIALKLWSDFGAHIPLIRSFSMGDNLSRLFDGRGVEYPIFPGEPIRYHFLFYMLVGLLERIGVRIDWALNVPSALGFFLLLAGIYLFALQVFKKPAVALLSLVFFLFNGSLAFLRFFHTHPLSTRTIQDIINAREFPAFAPWGEGWVTAFWNLNIYTNQRHLAAAFALVLLFILHCLTLMRKPRRTQLPWAVLWGIAMGILPYFHQPTLLITAIIMAVYFLGFPRLRWFLVATGALGLLLILPQILTMPEGSAQAFEWHPGYILHNELTVSAFVTHWFYNLGLHAILVPIGFLLVPLKTKRLFLPLIPLFLIPNLFKFSVEVTANHKFFNFMMILGAMLSAYAIVWILHQWSRVPMRPLRLLLQAVTALSLVGALTLSGLIDFFVVFNDTRGRVPDVAADEAATWIARNTDPGAIFLNHQYLYHPASIAGRRIFLGWPYFPWSAGYRENRMPVMNTMYESRDTSVICPLLARYNISFITVKDVQGDSNLPRIDLSYYLATYQPAFVSSDRRSAIFATETICP